MSLATINKMSELARFGHENTVLLMTTNSFELLAFQKAQSLTHTESCINSFWCGLPF